MGKRSAALAAIAMIAMASALWVEISERKPSPEEARLAAAHQREDALAESRLRAEILERHRAEQEATKTPDDSDGDGPLPDAVLRRSESGKGSALQRVQDSQDAALARLRESLDALTLQTERSDRALRRDLEQVQAEVRREREVSGKVRVLLIASLIPLVLHLLFTLRAPERKKPPA